MVHGLKSANPDAGPNDEERGQLCARNMTRIGSIRMADPTRAEFDDSVSVDDLHELTKQPRLRILQCSAPVRDAVWSRGNEHFCATRQDVELRVYGLFLPAPLLQGCNKRLAIGLLETS
jgi:hypothetical protein